MPYIVVRSIDFGINPRTGDLTPGHAWIEIHGPDGSIESFGYYPESNPLMGPGEIRDSDARYYADFGNTSQSFSITEEQAQDIRNYAAQVNTGTYEFIPGFFGSNNNCASFAAGAMGLVGIEAMIPMTCPPSAVLTCPRL